MWGRALAASPVGLSMAQYDSDKHECRLLCAQILQPVKMGTDLVAYKFMRYALLIPIHTGVAWELGAKPCYIERRLVASSGIILVEMMMMLMNLIDWSCDILHSSSITFNLICKFEMSMSYTKNHQILIGDQKTIF